MLSEYTIQWENCEEIWQTKITKQTEASRKSTKILCSILKSIILFKNTLTAKRKRRCLYIFLTELCGEWGIFKKLVETDDVFVSYVVYDISWWAFVWLTMNCKQVGSGGRKRERYSWIRQKYKYIWFQRPISDVVWRQHKIEQLHSTSKILVYVTSTEERNYDVHAQRKDSCYMYMVPTNI
jgi:hypothetical protein